MKSALVTGATGFIGLHLVEALRAHGLTVYATSRRPELIAKRWSLVKASRKQLSMATGIVDSHSTKESKIIARIVDFNQSETITSSLCEDVDTIFHLAGIAHSEDKEGKDDDRHWHVTAQGTQALLANANYAGVSKFIFVSTTKAMSEGGASCMDENSPVQPRSAYGRAKLAAEQFVLEAGKTFGMHVCVLRLPLVYGAGNKGNIPRMIKAIAEGRFPPIPDTSNKRSMVHVDDVVQAMLLAAKRPEAAGKIYILTDDEVYSTRRIYTAICHALNKKIPSWTIPSGLLRLGAEIGEITQRLLGRPISLTHDTLDKLLGSAWYSSKKITEELGYRPSLILESALPEMVNDYRQGLLSGSKNQKIR